MLINIERERDKMELSQQKTAELLHVCRQTYANYVNETVPLPSDVLLRMADMFHCGAEYLLEGSKFCLPDGRAKAKETESAKKI